MMYLRFLVLAALFVATAVHTPARADQGGYYLTYVAANGSDANPCTISSPCATLASAISKTATGGVVACLSLPTVSNLTIVSSVTIDCPALADAAVTINLPSNDSVQVVHLRGLTFVGLNDFTTGVTITAAKSVILENLNLKTFAGQGVLDQRSSPGKLIIKDTVISQNGGPGVVIVGATGNSALLDNVTSSGNKYGVAVAAGNSVSIVRSDIYGNSVAGVEGDGGSQITVDGSTINNNSIGIQSTQSIRLSNNNISFNVTAISGSSGTFGNNRFSGNTSIGTAPSPLGGASSDFAQQ
jgi:hypothetical protein